MQRVAYISERRRNSHSLKTLRNLRKSKLVWVLLGFFLPAEISSPPNSKTRLFRLNLNPSLCTNSRSKEEQQHPFSHRQMFCCSLVQRRAQSPRSGGKSFPHPQECGFSAEKSFLSLSVTTSTTVTTQPSTVIPCPRKKSCSLNFPAKRLCETGSVVRSAWLTMSRRIIL